MPKKEKAIDYRGLLISAVKEKYFNLMLGMIISLIVSTLLYRFFLKNIPLNVAFTLPRINWSKPENKVVQKSVKKTVQKTYVIEEGDDLWHIAEKFYGSGFNAYDISLANNITDASILTAGSKITIPDVKRREPTVGETSSVATGRVTFTEGKYVVQPGDSLSVISQKVYGDLFSWPRILAANNLTNADQIEVGMVLIIPQ